MAKEANLSILLMQDGAPSHANKGTMEALWAERLEPVLWPPFLPDLNPVESVWNTEERHTSSAPWGCSKAATVTAIA